ncbi:MAG TPA: type II toxin-antitoxin system RelE/ParE family toxin [Caulobacteraceae bacterium]|jgi:putative addiction module killer protein
MKVVQTETFKDWFEGLRDRMAQNRILVRIGRLERGNFGDAKVFDGIRELRIPYGPGYRLYFMRRGEEVVLLLIGGDKSSQRRDIARAKRLAREVNEDGRNDPAL